MGITHGTTSSATGEPNLCWLCSSKYQRKRLSACTCNHCSHPLCADCMSDHTNELPQNVVQLTQLLHDLEKLLQVKQIMVREEVSMSTEEVKQYFKTTQNELIEANHTITVGIEKEKQNAEKYLNKICSELQTVHGDIETLAGEPVYQPKRMEALLNHLNDIQEKLQTYEVTKDTKLQVVIPQYSLKFECKPASMADTTETPVLEPSHSQDNVRKNKNHRRKFHPYKNNSNNSATTKHTSSYIDETYSS